MSGAWPSFRMRSLSQRSQVILRNHDGKAASRVDVADVITAVNFARENRLALAMRGGGHKRPRDFCSFGVVQLDKGSP
jgi:hypothetical protein